MKLAYVPVISDLDGSAVQVRMIRCGARSRVAAHKGSICSFRWNLLIILYDANVLPLDLLVMQRDALFRFRHSMTALDLLSDEEDVSGD